MYSKLYYRKKLKPFVDAEWERHIAENPDLERKKGENFRHRNATLKKFFDVETDEVKAEVKKRREEGYFSEDEDIELDDDIVEAIDRRRRTMVLGMKRQVISLFSKYFLT